MEIEPTKNTIHRYPARLLSSSPNPEYSQDEYPFSEKVCQPSSLPYTLYTCWQPKCNNDDSQRWDCVSFIIPGIRVTLPLANANKAKPVRVYMC